MLENEFPELLEKELPELLEKEFPELLEKEFPELLEKEFPELLENEGVLTEDVPENVSIGKEFDDDPTRLIEFEGDDVKDDEDEDEGRVRGEGDPMMVWKLEGWIFLGLILDGNFEDDDEDALGDAWLIGGNLFECFCDPARAAVTVCNNNITTT